MLPVLILVALPHVYARPPAPVESYPLPASELIFVAPGGSDGADGAIATPFATLGHAIQVANAKSAGARWTIVLRGGDYREGELTITRPNITVQAYPGEHARLLGSIAQDAGGFAGAGPYTKTLTAPDPDFLELDCSDTFPGNPGAKDPGAETPLSVSVQGVPLRRVLGAPAAGQYAYDAATNTLTLADAPTEVEIPSFLYAIRSRADGTRIAGLDVQGYATCTLDWSKTTGGKTFYKGSILLYKDTPGDAPGMVLEGSTVALNTGGGVALAHGNDITLRNNVIVDNGHCGVQAGRMNRLVLTGNDISYNNVRRWDTTTDAGMKATHIEDGVLWGNRFAENVGQGFWCDQHCGASDPIGTNRWFVFAANLMARNDENGLFYEVSHHAVVASNVAHANGRAGLFVSGSRNVQLWNNTLIDNDVEALSYMGNLSVVDDGRCVGGDVLPDGSNCSGRGLEELPEGDSIGCELSSRGPLANTCNVEHTIIMNNIVSGSGSARPVVNVEDPNAPRYGAQYLVDASDYQAYWRPDATSPTNLLEWQNIAGSNAVAYATLDLFRAAVSARELNSLERQGGARHPFFRDLEGGDFDQDETNVDVWGRGASLPPEVVYAVSYPSGGTTAPTPLRIGAFAWWGKAGGVPGLDGGGPLPDASGLDAAPGADGGGPGRDGAGGTDGGTDGGSSGGCGCRVGGADATPRGASWLLLALVSTVIARYRRRGTC